MIEPNYIYNCRCTEVYDGDTITIDIDLGFNFKHQDQKLRLYGINAPEMKTGSARSKVRGAKSRDYVRAAILGKEVLVQFFKNPSSDSAKQEKYGRYLAVIYYTVDGVQRKLNEEMVTLGLAVPYMLD